jgi:hypothetical protein
MLADRVAFSGDEVNDQPVPDIPPERLAELRIKAREVRAKFRADKDAARAERHRRPHLRPIGDGAKVCSICGYRFRPDVSPSMSVAFVQHLQAAHKSAQVSDVSRKNQDVTRSPGTSQRPDGQETRRIMS